MAKLIKLLGVGDYFFVVGRNSTYNTSGRLELHTLNSDGFIALGRAQSFVKILRYKRGI